MAATTLAAAAAGGGAAARKKAPPPTIAQRAQKEIDPVIAAITAAANAKAAAASQAIQGLAGSYAHQLAGIDYGAPYANELAGTAAVDAALRDSLAGGGSKLASALSSDLGALAGSSGAPAVQQEAAALTSRGESAGNTRLASGSAALDNLLAQAAAGKGYGAAMPGIVDLAGLQGAKQAEGNAQQAIDQGVQQEEAQLPSIMQQIKSDRMAAKNLKLTRAKDAATLAQGNQRLAIEAQSAANTAQHDRALEAQAQANYGLSAARLALAQQKAVRLQKAGGLTPYEKSQIRQKAASDLQSYYHGVAARYQIGPDGSRVLVAGTGPGSAKTYQQAIKSLVLSYPALGPKQIVKMANKLYKPGEGGRPAKPLKWTAANQLFAGLSAAITNPNSGGGAPFPGG